MTKTIPALLFCLALSAGCASATDTATAKPAPARNLFVELLDKSPSEVDAKIQAAWQQLFCGDEASQRVYYEKGDEAWIADVGHEDVRSEGVSYGMMIAVQLDKKAQFDRLWKWAKTHMYHPDGPCQGYFAWQCRYDGTQIDPGSASDGEEWMAMSLLFASHRWGNGSGLLNYNAEAQALLRALRDSHRSHGFTAIFDPKHHQAVFAPSGEAATFTDPSYHLPAFYELWARWDESAEGRAFWAACAQESRAFFKRAAHPQTGLMSEYANFDGTPYTGTAFGEGKNDFRFDAWRIMSNVAVDYSWFGKDPWAVEQSNRILGYFKQHLPDLPTEATLDGKPLSRFGSPGVPAMAATAGLAADPALARPFVKLLWDSGIPSGKWRYYDGLVYFLGLLEVSGNFRIYPPSGN